MLSSSAVTAVPENHNRNQQSGFSVEKLENRNQQKTLTGTALLSSIQVQVRVGSLYAIQTRLSGYIVQNVISLV